MPEAQDTGAGRARLGALLVGASAVAFSTAGLLAALVAADAWTVLFWRGLFGGLFIAAFVAAQHGRAALSAVRGVGMPGLAAAACSTASTICFVHALRHTTVAEVTVIYAAAPFVAALVAWLWLGERAERATLRASALALSGVLVIARPADAGGHLPGNLLALAMTALVATMMVIVRHHRRVSRPSPAHSWRCPSRGRRRSREPISSGSCSSASGSSGSVCCCSPSARA